jgi:DNA invertase Pin-like site-specific DNA recombinase
LDHGKSKGTSQEAKELACSEKQSGAESDRAALAGVLPALESGDVPLDRLARSTRDLLNVLATVSERGGGFRSLSDPWADTTTPHGRLKLTVLGGGQNSNAALILSRTSEGRTRAMARGINFGRKSTLTQHQVAEAIRRRDAGEALTETAKTYAVSHSTLSRL